MTRKTLLAFAAVAALAVPASAVLAETSDDPALAALQTLCRATGNDYNAITQAAAAGGWEKASLEPDAEDGVSVTSKAAWEKAFGQQSVTVLASQGVRHFKSGDVPETTCKISTSKADAGVIDRTNAWLGFAPDNNTDPTLAIYYVKSGSSDKPEHIAGDGTPAGRSAALQAAMNGGALSILKVQQDQGSVILAYQSYGAK